MQLVERLTSDGIVYFAAFLFLFAFTLVECAVPLQRPVRFLFARISVVGLTLMLGLRWQTGTDWYPYLALFENLTLDVNSLLAVYSFDVGYVFLNALVRLFTDSYTIFLLVNSAIAMTLVYVFIRRTSPYPNTSLFIFFNSYFVAHYMGSNRRVIAIGFVLLLFAEARRVNLARFAVLQALAVAFHRSSIVAMLARVIPDKPLSRRQIVLMLLVCGVLGALQLPGVWVESLGRFLANYSNLEIIDKMVFYGETSAEHVSENVNVFVQTVLALSKRAIFLALFFHVLRDLKDNRHYTRLLNVYLVGIAIYVLFIGTSIFQVLSTYFTATDIALMGIAAASLKHRSQRIVLCCVLFPYGLLQLASAINPYPQEYLPYISVLSGGHR
jgi:hypothetical protein